MLDEIIGTSDNNSTLLVRTTRTGDDEATISYPVQVYVFQGEECKKAEGLIRPQTGVLKAEGLIRTQAGGEA